MIYDIGSFSSLSQNRAFLQGSAFVYDEFTILVKGQYRSQVVF
jgi:sRNA-binding regulator protein Hfq